MNSVTLSISELYRYCGKFPCSHNTFVSDDGYFDLYNNDGELCCMDGEDVEVVGHNDGIWTLKNTHGDNDVYFSLTDAEFEVARVL